MADACTHLAYLATQPAPDRSSIIDGTVVNAALPAISRDFHTGLADLQWVVTGDLLTLGALLVIGGSPGDLFGRRRVFIIGLIGFATSLLSGVAPFDRDAHRCSRVVGRRRRAARPGESESAA